MHLAKVLTIFVLISYHATALAQSSCPTVLDPWAPISNFNLSRTEFVNAGDIRLVRSGGDRLSSDGPSQRPKSDDVRSYVVQVVRDGSVVCTASSLNSKYVLCAARCSAPSSENDEVRFFNHGSGLWDVRRKVSSALVHPQYVSGSATGSNDVMLLELEGDAPKTAAFVTVNFEEGVPRMNAYFRMSGFGMPNSGSGGSNEAEEAFRYVDLPNRSKASCKSFHRSDIDSTQSCAGYVCGGCHVCEKDSGGPLLQFDQAGFAYQVGIAVFGSGCERLSATTVFTRVSQHTDWILSNMQEGSGIYRGGMIPQVLALPSACPV